MKLKYLEEALIFITGVYSELCQRSKMRRFAKIVKNYKLLTIFAKCSILEAWQGPEYFRVIQYLTIIAYINYLFHCKICCRKTLNM